MVYKEVDSVFSFLLNLRDYRSNEGSVSLGWNKNKGLRGVLFMTIYLLFSCLVYYYVYGSSSFLLACLLAYFLSFSHYIFLPFYHFSFTAFFTENITAVPLHRLPLHHHLLFQLFQMQVYPFLRSYPTFQRIRPLVLPYSLLISFQTQLVELQINI